MANATCQFTQGVTIGGSGQSVFGFVPNSVVTMTDNGGAGATSYLWEVMSWPSPLSVAPTITNSTTQVATVTPTLDGVYIIRLTRTDGTGTTVDLKFFGVSDDDGLTLPSAGQTGNMTNQSADAQKGGWAGAANATTNRQLDAYLRFLKARVGRYVGKVSTASHSAGTTVTNAVTDGTSLPFRMITLTGSGLYTEELVNSPAPAEGKAFRYLVTISAGAGGLVVKNGVGGTTLLTLTAPDAGISATRWELEFVSDGTNWLLSRSTLLDPKANRTATDVTLVAGNQSTDQIIMTRIGSGRFNRSKYPTNATVTFSALIEATTGKTAQIQLYNLTDGAYVGTALSASNETPTWVEQVVTLPSTGDKDYEVVLRMTSSGGPGDRVTCTSARLQVRWG